MILVTGATGTVGREVVAQLLAAGQKVRALTRDPSKARLDARAEIVAGDLALPETLMQAVEGAERIFSVALGPQLGAQEGSLARAAKGAGVRHVVKLSVLGAGSGARSGVASWHDAGERAVQEAGIAWTFVRPGAFMSNALFWSSTIRSQGKVFSNFGNGKVPSIHPRDIAAPVVARHHSDQRQVSQFAAGRNGSLLQGLAARHAISGRHLEMTLNLSIQIGVPPPPPRCKPHASPPSDTGSRMPPIAADRRAQRERSEARCFLPDVVS